MKRLYYLFTYLYFTIFIVANVLAQAPTNGLVAYYPFNGDAKDASGNNNNGIVNGAILTTDRFEVTNKAYYFNGLNSKIRVEDTPILNFSSSFSISFWAKINVWNNGTIAGIMSKKLADDANGYVIYNDGLYSDKMNFRFKGSLSNHAYLYSNTIVTTGGWESWTVVYNSVNGITKLFRNGVLDKSYPTENAGNVSNTTPLYFGFSENWNGYLNGSLDEIRIYNRALSDGEVATLFAFENNSNLSNLKIVTLKETINQSSYTVPKEATVHHYFLVKNNTTDVPVKDVILRYQIGIDPAIRSSLPSDEDGLIDLNLTVGGPDFTISDDDWIQVSANTVQVRFLDVTNGTVTGTNAFTPFNITVIDKAEPLEKEEEISISATIDIGTGNEKIEKELTLGGKKIAKAVGKTNGGITLGPTVSFFRDKTNTNIWHIKGGANLGGVVGVNGELSLSLGKYNVSLNGGGEIGVDVNSRLNFDLDLNKMDQVFHFAKELISLNSIVEANQFKISNFFSKAAKNAQTLQNPFFLTGNSYGASLYGEINGLLEFKYEGSIKNYVGYAKNLKAGGALKLELAGRVGLDMNNELDFFSGVTYTATNTFGVDGKVSIDGLSRLTKKGESNFWQANLPIKIAEASVQNEVELKNFYDLNNNPNGSEFVVSTQSKTSLTPFDFRKINYKNIWKYSQRAREQITNSYLNKTDATIENNALASFMYDNFSNPFSILREYPHPQSFANQILPLHNFVLSKSNSTWSQDDISVSSQRELIFEYSRKAVGDIPIIGMSLGELGFSYSNTYIHKFEDAKYSWGLKRMLPTISYPDIITNLKQPNENIVDEFWNKVKTYTYNLPKQIFDESFNFVKKQTHAFINNVICFTNGTCDNTQIINAVRKNLAGEIIYGENAKNSIFSTSQPSILKFTVNPSPQVFTQNTSLSFEYYYPENQLEAVTDTDTLRIISDVFLMFAKDNGLDITEAPNGSFQISTIFSQSDLELTSLPLNTQVKLIFKPHGQVKWQIIGDVNTTILFRKVGLYAIAAIIPLDKITPIINTDFSNNTINITINDNAGLDWANTKIIVNGKNVNYQRTGSRNTITIPTSLVNILPENTFFVQVIAYDLSKNFASFERNFPCDYSNKITSLSGRVDSPIFEKALKSIISNSKLPNEKKVFFSSGGEIILEPGFETKGQVFKAEIGGCTTAPTNGLVAYYPFNGNANDESGNNYHGAIDGATLATDRKGSASKAFSFNGTNGRIRVEDTPNLNFSSSFSISFWAKINAWGNGTSAGIISKKINDPGNGYVIYNDGTYANKLNFRLKGTSLTQNLIPSNTSVTIGIWECWAMVYNSTDGSVKLFRNGVLDKNHAAGNIGNMSSTAPLYFGYSQTWNGYLNGSLDEIRIYNRAITDAEVLQIYNAEKP